MLLFLGSVFNSLPSNVVSDTGVRSPVRIFSVDLAPQGWGFFTRDPSEADLLFYRAETLEPLWVTPQGRVENAFGVSRTQRAQGPEAAALLEGVAESDWHECQLGQTLQNCVHQMNEDGTSVVTAVNESPVQTLCGPVIFSQSDPVPWSFRDLYEAKHLPRFVAELEIECS